MEDFRKIRGDCKGRGVKVVISYTKYINRTDILNPKTSSGLAFQYTYAEFLLSDVKCSIYSGHLAFSVIDLKPQAFEAIS